MKLHRFIGDYRLVAGDFSLKDKEIVHQLTKVLRLHPRENVILCDGRGSEAQGEIVSMEKSTILLKLDAPHTINSEPIRQTILYCAILKRENFEWVVQKTTEIGVTAIVPLITQRTVKQKLNLDRLRKIAQEAAEQSGRGQVPSIREPMALDDAMNHARANDANYFFELNAQKIASSGRPDKIGLFIGPEGGWDPGENKKAQASGLSIAGLGPLTLRGETAAIVAVYSMVI